jgi:hypothetical protein
MKFTVKNAKKFIEKVYEYVKSGHVFPTVTAEDDKVVVALSDYPVGYNAGIKTYIFDQEVGVLVIPTTATAGSVVSTNETLTESSVTALKDII